jgi:signal recognition particle receptor subunit beta
MVLFNYSTRELTAKIVYYGPGLCGKTTNLQYIHSTLPDNVKGKMLSLATKTDRTLFFDFLPIDLGQIRGMKTRVQLYTVPGQVFYNETRKLVLKGADGIVFVADSQATMVGANVESFKNLEENLKAHGMKLAEMPHVLQFNKRDLPKLSSIEELNAAINRFNAPFYESVATTGIGVQDTLKAITKLVLLHLTKKYDPKSAASAPVQAPSASVAVPAAPQPAEAPAMPVAAAPRPPATPSPAQTMQMPVASVVPPVGPSGSIPLSDAPTGAAAVSPAPPSAPAAEPEVSLGGPPSLQQPDAPAFADDEIQELVDEVQESELSPELVSPEPPPAAIPEVPVMPEEQVVDFSNQPESFDLDAMDPTPKMPPEPPMVPVQPSAVASEGESSAPPFEIDHGIDPEWAADAPPAIVPDLEPSAPEIPGPPPMEAPAETDADGAWDLGSVDDVPSTIDEPTPEPLPPVASTPPPPVEPTDAMPDLTEVVGDRDMFDDPSIDVARMVAGEEREIVVPLEIEEPDKTVQRFKLSIRLRMDPVE